MAEKQPSIAKEFLSPIKEIWIKEIGTKYCASLLKSIPILL